MNSSNKTTVKVSRKTIERMHQVLGSITEKERRHVTLEDVIVHLLDFHEASDEDFEKNRDKMQKDREAFLALLKTTFVGIEQADYKDFDFDDIGG